VINRFAIAAESDDPVAARIDQIDLFRTRLIRTT
jgi:hypothetical protein